MRGKSITTRYYIRKIHINNHDVSSSYTIFNYDFFFHYMFWFLSEKSKILTNFSHISFLWSLILFNLTKIKANQRYFFNTNTGLLFTNRTIHVLATNTLIYFCTLMSHSQILFKHWVIYLFFLKKRLTKKYKWKSTYETPRDKMVYWLKRHNHNPIQEIIKFR